MSIKILTENVASSVKIFNRSHLAFFRENIRKKADFYRLDENEIADLVEYYRYALSKMGFYDKMQINPYSKYFSYTYPSPDLKRKGLVKKRKVIKQEKSIFETD